MLQAPGSKYRLAHPLGFQVQGVAVLRLPPVCDRMLGVVPPAADVATNEADPQVLQPQAGLWFSSGCQPEIKVGPIIVSQLPPALFGCHCMLW